MSKRWMVGLLAVVVVGVALVAFWTNQASDCPTETVCTTNSGHITPADYVNTLQSQPHFLLDVRTPEEYAEGHIAHAANIAVETLAANLQSVPHDVPVVVYCHSGRRAAQAVQILKDAGYTSVYDLGGIADWQAQGLPIGKS